eukprot:scaffold494_cov245-Pinguiococcus_pyrenoidosus.AAC.14
MQATVVREAFQRPPVACGFEVVQILHRPRPEQLVRRSFRRPNRPTNADERVLQRRRRLARVHDLRLISDPEAEIAEVLLECWHGLEDERGNRRLEKPRGKVERKIHQRKEALPFVHRAQRGHAETNDVGRPLALESAVPRVLHAGRPGREDLRQWATLAHCSRARQRQEKQLHKRAKELPLLCRIEATALVDHQAPTLRQDHADYPQRRRIQFRASLQREAIRTGACIESQARHEANNQQMADGLRSLDPRLDGPSGDQVGHPERIAAGGGEFRSRAIREEQRLHRFGGSQRRQGLERVHDHRHFHVFREEAEVSPGRVHEQQRSLDGRKALPHHRRGAGSVAQLLAC